MIENNGLINSTNSSVCKKSITHKNIFIFLIILVFIKMLVLNFLTPIFSDDYGYATSTSVLDALQREYARYMDYNGKSIAGFFIRFFLMLPNAVFSILNALTYTVLTIFIYIIANPKKQYHVILYLFIVFSIWLYTLTYGQATLWLTGSITYLWGSAIILSFLLPYSLYLSDKPVFKRKYVPIAGMFILGILAGWCYENTSGGMILIVILLLIGCNIFKHKIKMWMISGAIGSVIGYLFLILAPGNYTKNEYDLFIDDRHILVIMSERFVNLTNILRDDFAVLIMVFIVFVTMQIVIKNWKRVFISFTFFLASIATTYALILSPWIPERALLGTTVFLIIACAHSLAGLSIEKKLYKIAVISFVCVLAFHFLTSFIIAIDDIGKTGLTHHRRVQFIKSEINLGNQNVILPHHLRVNTSNLPPRNPLYRLPDMTSDASFWYNRRIAEYYGLESIRWE